MMRRVEENKEKMSPESFCYWLQGALELMDPEKLSKKQLQIVKDHLVLVFKKVTPDYGTTTTTITIPDVEPLIYDHGSLCSCPACAQKPLNTTLIC